MRISTMIEVDLHVELRRELTCLHPQKALASEEVPRTSG